MRGAAFCQQVSLRCFLNTMESKNKVILSELETETLNTAFKGYNLKETFWSTFGVTCGAETNNTGQPAVKNFSSVRKPRTFLDATTASLVYP